MCQHQMQKNTVLPWPTLPTVPMETLNSDFSYFLVNGSLSLTDTKAVFEKDAHRSRLRWFFFDRQSSDSVFVTKCRASWLSTWRKRRIPGLGDFPSLIWVTFWHEFEFDDFLPWGRRFSVTCQVRQSSKRVWLFPPLWGFLGECLTIHSLPAFCCCCCFFWSDDQFAHTNSTFYARISPKWLI